MTATDITTRTKREVATIRLECKMPTIASDAYKYHPASRSSIRRNDVDYAGNFCAYVFPVPGPKLMWLIRSCRARWTVSLPLHEDHEQERIDIDRASGIVLGRETPLLVSQRVFACLWGPAQWAAQKPGLSGNAKRSARPEPHPDNSSARAKDKNDPFRLMALVTAFTKSRPRASP